MRAEATVRFLGKTTLVLKFEGKELACGAGKEVENAREAKVSISRTHQSFPLPIAHPYRAIYYIPGIVGGVFTCNNSFNSQSSVELILLLSP